MTGTQASNDRRGDSVGEGADGRRGAPADMLERGARPIVQPAGDAGEPLWVPSREWIDRTHLTAYMNDVGAQLGRPFGSYEDLWRWSVGELEQFWASIWERFGVRASAPYEGVLGSHAMPGASWFAGARLNYAENLLTREGSPADDVAVLHCSELRGLERLTRAELAREVAQIAAGLRSLGVGPGDRVAAYMPNIAETLIAFLATASIGAIWSSAAPEFGARSVIDRFAQIEPKVLLAVDGYRYGGRDFDRRAAVGTLLDELPSVRHLVLLGYLQRDPGRVRPGSPPAASGAPREWTWEGLREAGRGAAPNYEQVPFEHPLWVLYSSGTTGLPKAIVHSHGGILVEQLKKSYLHLDLHRGDRMFWYSTTGWMMWNFLVGCLLSDAAIVLYDGSPTHPGPDALWQLAVDTEMSCLGTSAGFLTAAMKESESTSGGPGERFDLARLRAIGSTGSPLSPEGFRWVYERVKRDLWLFSTSGGTDVCTAFVSGCPLLPVYAGELQCRALGCAVEAFNDAGESVVEEVGELVVTEPMPSMPIGLWGDAGGERYRDSYFAMFPGVWRHGDWIRITERGSAVIYGRSDATINRGGVRMGTSEIYRAVQALPEVLEALVVDIPRGEELAMVLFVVLRPGAELSDDLERAIRTRVREDCSPRHVPNEIVQVDAVPRTLSGKILEVPVKRILMGARPEDALSMDSLANPEALAQFLDFARQQPRAPARQSAPS